MKNKSYMIYLYHSFIIIIELYRTSNNVADTSNKPNYPYIANPYSN